MSDDLKSLTIEEVIAQADLDQTMGAELLEGLKQFNRILETDPESVPDDLRNALIAQIARVTPMFENALSVVSLHEEAMTALAERYAKMCSVLRCTRGDIKLVWNVVDYLDLATKWAVDSVEANQTVTGGMTPDGTLD